VDRRAVAYQEALLYQVHLVVLEGAAAAHIRILEDLAEAAGVVARIQNLGGQVEAAAGVEEKPS
jgi:hypothetical protein